MSNVGDLVASGPMRTAVSTAVFNCIKPTCVCSVDQPWLKSRRIFSLSSPKTLPKGCAASTVLLPTADAIVLGAYMHTRCSAAQQSCFGHSLGQRKLALLTHSVRRQCNPLPRPLSLVVKAQASPSEEQQEEVEYKDTWSDVQFINLCRRAYGNLAGWQSSNDWNNGEKTYQGMLEVSRALMKGKSASQQRDAVIKGFPKVPNWFRKIFPYSKWGAELNAQITPAFFTWLVGPMYTETADVNGVQQRSSVHIKRCRYLAESGCVGMCVNLCKTPTQTFFTEELGMPLTMKPNLDDYSCDMVFGQMPPSLDADDVNSQACYDACPQGKAGNGKCHKLG